MLESAPTQHQPKRERTRCQNWMPWPLVSIRRERSKYNDTQSLSSSNVRRGKTKVEQGPEIREKHQA